ncbi:hypothetical protein Val02_91290 [Virgisporangium aliadipatigenens]|uniref:PPIase cyclophilin-type domain-containing protein n=1 Tax=Virgisporangium aliadipatigenens TaxID=741659 RepID=A0A8J4DWG8_9ACTN|nr:peptidylprolyl isomerase [Virgisporangium aliadipatigenens]GIJ52243.1 hypothetical protein Val02_91290 [Virgisporangium aliadipatigenens]
MSDQPPVGSGAGQPPASEGAGRPPAEGPRTGPFPPVTSPHAPGRQPAPSTGEFPLLPTPFPAGPASGAPTFPPASTTYPPPAPFHQMGPGGQFGPGGYPPPAPRRSSGVLLAVVGGTLALLLLVACGVVIVILRASPPQAAHAPAAGPPAATGAPAAGALDCGITTAPPPPGNAPGPPDVSSAPRTGTATMRLATNLGEITVAMDRAKTPCTVANFAHLARSGFLANSTCHRLVTAAIFVLQCGDPTGTGAGTPGYAFRDENLAGARYARGVVAMANAGPGTNGSQFFIVYADSLDLPAQYTPFGTVGSGLDIVRRVAEAGVDPVGATDGAPRMKLTLRSVTVTA